MNRREVAVFISMWLASYKNDHAYGIFKDLRLEFDGPDLRQASDIIFSLGIIDIDDDSVSGKFVMNKQFTSISLPLAVERVKALFGNYND